MEKTATIDLFDIEFNFIKEQSLFGQNQYNIIEDFKNKPLDYENSLKIKIENYMIKYINDNIEKLPYEPGQLSYLLNFDYKSKELRLNDIKSIVEIDIKSIKLIYKNESYKLLLTHHVLYKNTNNRIMLLLPQLKNPIELDISINK